MFCIHRSLFNHSAHQNFGQCQYCSKVFQFDPSLSICGPCADHDGMYIYRKCQKKLLTAAQVQLHNPNRTKRMQQTFLRLGLFGKNLPPNQSAMLLSILMLLIVILTFKRSHRNLSQLCKTKSTNIELKLHQFG